jgi:hypothetical protein
MTDEPRNEPDSASRPHAYEAPLVEDITPDMMARCDRSGHHQDPAD